MALLVRLGLVAVICIFVVALAQEPANRRLGKQRGGDERSGDAGIDDKRDAPPYFIRAQEPANRRHVKHGGGDERRPPRIDDERAEHLRDASSDEKYGKGETAHCTCFTYGKLDNKNDYLLKSETYKGEISLIKCRSKDASGTRICVNQSPRIGLRRFP